MADTADVVKELDIKNSESKLLAIIANERGAEDALRFEKIGLLGFPFSVSPTFQQRNTNSSIEASFIRVKNIQTLCNTSNRRLVVYLSMGFGNPYGDAYSTDMVLHWAREIATLGVSVISLADTVGLATPEEVEAVTSLLIKNLPGIEVGVHLHSTPVHRKQKIQAALNAGCTRFDGAINGIGGCPMANDELVGNMDTLQLIHYFEQQHLLTGINHTALANAVEMANEIFI